MSETDHQSELIEAKQKAYGILEAQGVLDAVLRIVGSWKYSVSLLEKYNSPVRGEVTTTPITAEAKHHVWEHFTYSMGKESIEIRVDKHAWRDEDSQHAEVHVLHNEELVLKSRGSMWRMATDYGFCNWQFSEYGAAYLELAKLDEVWITAIKAIADELHRVGELAFDESQQSAEEAAKKEQANFDLGEYE